MATTYDHPRHHVIDANLARLDAQGRFLKEEHCPGRIGRPQAQWCGTCVARWEDLQ
jgi:hypothetical protein